MISKIISLILIFIFISISLKLLYDSIDTLNSDISLSLIVTDEISKIDFKIIDPKGKLILYLKDQIHIFHKYQAYLTGEYIYIIDNKKNNSPSKVSFSIHQGKSCDLHVNKKHLNDTFSSIRIIKHLTKSAGLTARILTKKYESHYDYVDNNNKNIFFLQ